MLVKSSVSDARPKRKERGSAADAALVWVKPPPPVPLSRRGLPNHFLTSVWTIIYRLSWYQ